MYTFHCLDNTTVQESKRLVHSISPLLKQVCSRNPQEVVPFFSSQLTSSAVSAVFQWYKNQQTKTTTEVPLILSDVLSLVNTLPSLFGIGKTECLYRTIMSKLRSYLKKELNPSHVYLFEIYYYWIQCAENSVKSMLLQFLHTHMTTFVEAIVKNPNPDTTLWPSCSKEFVVTLLNEDQINASEDELFTLACSWMNTQTGVRTLDDFLQVLACIRSKYLVYYKSQFEECIRTNFPDIASSFLKENSQKPQRNYQAMFKQASTTNGTPVQKEFRQLTVHFVIHQRAIPKEQTPIPASPDSPFMKLTFTMEVFNKDGTQVGAKRKAVKRRRESPVEEERPAKKQFFEAPSTIYETRPDIYYSSYTQEIDSGFYMAPDIFLASPEPNVEPLGNCVEQTTFEDDIISPLDYSDFLAK